MVEDYSLKSTRSMINITTLPMVVTVVAGDGEITATCGKQLHHTLNVRNVHSTNL